MLSKEVTLMFRYGLLISLAFLSLVCSAQVYKHVDEDGNVTYTDKPPAESELIEIREPNTLAPPPKIDYPKKAPKAAATSYDVKITSPAPETVIPRGPGNFSVSASVSPSLQSGAQLQLLLDGVKEGEPQRGSSWALTNVYRGARELSVAVIDARGKELARSEPVTIYVFRPSKNF
jgi:hypothetical protein